MTLSRDQILNAVDAKTLEVSVPEWDGSVLIRVLAGHDRDQLEADFVAAGKGQGKPNFRARFASLVICDDRGSRLFSEQDVKRLGEKSSLALDRVLDAGMRLNRLGPEEVKQLAGESEGDRSSASGSGSPSPSG